MAREPSLAAAEIERPRARSWKKLDEEVAMVRLEVLVGLTCERDEVGSVLLPGRSEVGGLESSARRRPVAGLGHAATVEKWSRRGSNP